MMQLRIKNSFIPWSFPEIVAKEEGFFADEGIDVTFYALDPKDVEPGNKVQWYGGLVDLPLIDEPSIPLDLVPRLDVLGIEGVESDIDSFIGEKSFLLGRSEERRVGKECRSRWSPYH